MANRLKEKYLNEVVPALTEQFNYSSVMAVPKVDKIVLNMGVGDAVSNAKNLEKAAEELALISGQKPLITKAKKSIAGFRLREGVAIGAKVTLRGERMYEFLDKLVSVSLPCPGSPAPQICMVAPACSTQPSSSSFGNCKTMLVRSSLPWRY